MEMNPMENIEVSVMEEKPRLTVKKILVCASIGLAAVVVICAAAETIKEKYNEVEDPEDDPAKANIDMDTWSEVFNEVFKKAEK